MADFKSMAPEAQTQAVAIRFAALLRRAIGSAKFFELRRRNATPEYRGGDACASHDFIDANDVMADAITRLIGRDFQLDEETDPLAARLWCDGWNVASDRFLTARKSVGGVQ